MSRPVSTQPNPALLEVPPLSDLQLRGLAAARSVADSGTFPVARSLMAPLGITYPQARRLRKGLVKLKLWDWPDPRRLTAGKVMAAAEAIEARGELMTYAALTAESGLNRSIVQKAVYRMMEAGVWRWEVATMPGRTMGGRSLRPEVAPKYLPTAREYAMRSYRILRRFGFPPEEARRRVVAKAARCGA